MGGEIFLSYSRRMDFSLASAPKCFDPSCLGPERWPFEGYDGLHSTMLEIQIPSSSSKTVSFHLKLERERAEIVNDESCRRTPIKNVKFHESRRHFLLPSKQCSLFV